MLPELSQSQKDNYLYKVTRVLKLTETEGEWSLPGVGNQEEGKKGSRLKGTEFHTCKMKKFW